MDLLDAILIIDDEEDQCALLTVYFRRREITVTCVHTHMEAIKRLPTMRPTLVFLDNDLPDGFGISLIPKIKYFSTTAVIVVTTRYGVDSIRETALGLGADKLMNKPFSMQQINDLMLEIG